MNVQNPLNRRPTSRTRWLGGLAAPLAAAIMMALPTTSHAHAAFYLSVNVAPPPLPIYEQPAMPGMGYIWTPGYWAYSDDGYFWVPGCWVRPAYRGALWTPGYWGYGEGGAYVFNAGYWGPHIGFYGGINYGYGYGGRGYEGGYWRNGGFYYNRGVNNFGSVNVTNVYNRTIINNTTINNTSFNGGTGGIAARATQAELLAARDRHIQAVSAQQQQVKLASQNRALLASVNHGAPPIAATQKAGVFRGPGVVKAHELSPEARAAVDRAVRAKPVGAPVKSVAALSAHTAGQGHANVAGQTGAAHANAHAAFGQKTAATARKNRLAAHGTAGGAGTGRTAHTARPMTQSHQPQPRQMAQPHQQQPRQMAQPHQHQARPMAQQHQQQPRQMAQPRQQQPRQMAQPRQPQRGPAPSSKRQDGH